MKKLIMISISLAAIALMSSCNDNATKELEKEEKKEVSNGEHENSNTATLTEEQIKIIGIETGYIEEKELTKAIKANGILTVPNQNKAFITPLYSGVVKSLNVQPGSFVKQGDAIATIVNPNLLQMQQQLQQLNTQIALSETELKRQQELVEGNASPLKKLQQVQTELATLKSQRSGLQKQLSGVGASQEFSSAITIKAPITGTISKVNSQLGSNVDVSSPIAEIVNNSQLHLDLYVYEKDLPKLKPNQTIHFTITNNAGKEYDAEIFSIGTAFEANSKTIPVHAKVKGDKTGLIDGMNITALVSLDKSTVAAVPADAIVNYQGKDFIFIVTDPHAENNHIKDTAKSIAIQNKEQEKKNSKSITFEKIPVAKGTSDVGYSEITPLKDIPANTKIVTKGAFFILAKITNKGEEE